MTQNMKVHRTPYTNIGLAICAIKEEKVFFSLYIMRGQYILVVMVELALKVVNSLSLSKVNHKYLPQGILAIIILYLRWWSLLSVLLNTSLLCLKVNIIQIISKKIFSFIAIKSLILTRFFYFFIGIVRKSPFHWYLIIYLSQIIYQITCSIKCIFFIII